MSRIGKKPVPLPAGVNASISGQTVEVKGPKGILTFTATDTPTKRPVNPGKEAEEAERMSALLRAKGFTEDAETIRAKAAALRKMQEDALPLEVRISKVGRARDRMTQRMMAYVQEVETHLVNLEHLREQESKLISEHAELCKLRPEDAFGEAPVQNRDKVISALIGMGLLTMRQLEARSYDPHYKGDCSPTLYAEYMKDILEGARHLHLVADAEAKNPDKGVGQVQRMFADLNQTRPW